MGIFSAVAKVAKSVVKAVSKAAPKAAGAKAASSGAKAAASSGSIFSKAKRVVKAAPDFIFGTGSDVGAKAMKATKGSFWTKLKAGAKAIVKDSEKASAKGGNFFKRLWKGTVSIPSSLVKGSKVGARAAKMAGKSTFLGGAKGVLKAIGKKMPLIGSLLCVGFEIPNIYSAIKDEGLGTGLKEAGKAAVRLAGGAAGAMLGTFVGGPLGGIIGFAAGEWLLGKLTGDSYSDKKDFLNEVGYDDATIKQLKEQGYSFDEIYNIVKGQVEAAEEQAEQQPVPDGQTPTQPLPSDPQQPVTPTQPLPSDPQQPVTPTLPLPSDPQQPITQTPGEEQVSITQEQLDTLRQLGLTDDDIQALLQSGYSYEDIIALVSHIKGGDQTITSMLPSGNISEDYLEPFVLPYQNIQNGSSYYNSAIYSNPYTADTYYNLLLNSFSQQPDYMSNPFSSSNLGNYQTAVGNEYRDQYYRNGRLGYSA